MGAWSGARLRLGLAIKEDNTGKPQVLSSTLYSKAWGGLTCLPVPSEQRFRPDHKHVEEHLQAVFQHAHLCRWGMRPPDRHLHGRQAVVSRQVKQFGVEPEALDGLLLENDPAALPAKRLEPALSIHKRQAQNDADNPVEHHPGKLAEHGLMRFDQATIHSPAANGHIMSIQSGE